MFTQRKKTKWKIGKRLMFSNKIPISVYYITEQFPGIESVYYYGAYDVNNKVLMLIKDKYGFVTKLYYKIEDLNKASLVWQEWRSGTFYSFKYEEIPYSEIEKIYK